MASVQCVFVSVKFERMLKNFNNGASEMFGIVVSNFNRNVTIPVEEARRPSS